MIIIDLETERRQYEIIQDESLKIVLEHLHSAFYGSKSIENKTIQEWINWLVNDIKNSWLLAQEQNISQEDFISEYSDELGDTFSRSNNPQVAAINSGSIKLIVSNIIKK